MEQLFFHFRGKDQKDVVKIIPQTRYNSLELISLDSILINQNVFSIAEGTKLADILQLQNGSNIAISKKLKILLEEHCITGWGAFPIIIKGINDSYFGFQTLGKAGKILNLEALNNLDDDYVEFDINTWDGSDIFNLEKTLYNACTPKVIELFESNGITNVEFFRL